MTYKELYELMQEVYYVYSSSGVFYVNYKDHEQIPILDPVKNNAPKWFFKKWSHTAMITSWDDFIKDFTLEEYIFLTTVTVEEYVKSISYK